MLRIAIVDDEEYFVLTFGKMVDEEVKYYNDTCQISLYTDGMQFHADCNHKKFDLIFLDIDMPSIHGFDLARYVSFICNATIIFVSAHEKLVFSALQYRPFRFVRKNHLENDLQEAVHAYLEYEKGTRAIFSCDTESGMFTGEMIRIIYFESFGHDIYFQFADKDTPFRLRRKKGKEWSMQKLYELFAEKGFIRIHKSYLLNYRYIYQITPDNVILQNQKKILINPRNADEIKGAFQKFVFLEAHTR